MQDSQNLGAAIDALEVERGRAARRLQGIEEALKLLREISGVEFTPPGMQRIGILPHKATVQSDDPLANAGLAIHEAAALVLEMEDKPMKAIAIADRLAKSAYPYPNPLKMLQRSVASAMARHCDGDDGLFFRAGHGVYGLRKLQKEESPPDGATEETAGHPVTGSIPDPVASARREEDASNTSLPLSEGL